jgi:hypothetical protein
MAGQASRRGIDRTGRTDGRSTSARAIRFPEIEQIESDVPTEERVQVFVEAPLAPDFVSRTVRTEASYRLLTATGLTGAEAAGVIAYVVGLKACEQPWILKQVNKVLFLRELYASGDWGEAERKPA